MRTVGLKWYDVVPDGELYHTSVARTGEDVVGMKIECGGLMRERSTIVSQLKKHTLWSTHNASLVALQSDAVRGLRMIFEMLQVIQTRAHRLALRMWT